MINADAYVELESRFLAVFLSLKPSFSTDAVATVEHYISVAELEMACESLVLSLVEESIVISADLWQELLSLCRALGLDKESVFKPDFFEFAQARVLRQA